MILAHNTFTAKGARRWWWKLFPLSWKCQDSMDCIKYADMIDIHIRIIDYDIFAICNGKVDIEIMSTIKLVQTLYLLTARYGKRHLRLVLDEPITKFNERKFKLIYEYLVERCEGVVKSMIVYYKYPWQRVFAISYEADFDVNSVTFVKANHCYWDSDIKDFWARFQYGFSDTLRSFARNNNRSITRYMAKDARYCYEVDFCSTYKYAFYN